MPAPHESEPLSEREAFENGYYYFIQAVEVLALSAEAQCQRMGDYNVAWELKHDVAAAEHLLRSPSSDRLIQEQRNAVSSLLASLKAVPVNELPAGAGRRDNLVAMSHESWEPLRGRAIELLRLLEPATAECKRFLQLEKAKDSPTTLLSISESAYELILRELERSEIEDPAIALSYSRDTYPLPDEVLRMPPEQRDRALEEYRAALRNVPHELRARIVRRSDVPSDGLLQVRDLWFCFSPQWKAAMSGWFLDSLGDDLVLLDEKRNVVLPLQDR